MADFEDQFVDTGGMSRTARSARHMGDDEFGPRLQRALLQMLVAPDFQNRLSTLGAVQTDALAKAGMTELLDRVLRASRDGGNFDIAAFLDRNLEDHITKIAILQSAVCRLGEAWVCDDSNFLMVTIAVSRLQAALHRIGQGFTQHLSATGAPAAVILLPKGEQHRFGASLVEELFRARGWSTHLVTSAAQHDIESALEARDVRVVCIAWSDSRLMTETEQLLSAVTPAIENRDILVIAGGRAAQEKGDWLFKRGVDNVCADAYLAIKYAEFYALNKITTLAGFGAAQLSREQSSFA
jgi:methylmalonyl-CoA mutase cobalamin-binding subunit